MKSRGLRLIVFVTSLLLPIAAYAQSQSDTTTFMGFGPLPTMTVGVDIPMGPIAVRPQAAIPFPHTWGASVGVRTTTRVYPVFGYHTLHLPVDGTNVHQINAVYTGVGARMILRDPPSSTQNTPTDIVLFMEGGYAWRRVRWANPIGWRTDRQWVYALGAGLFF